MDNINNIFNGHFELLESTLSVRNNTIKMDLSCDKNLNIKTVNYMQQIMNAADMPNEYIYKMKLISPKLLNLEILDTITMSENEIKAAKSDYTIAELIKMYEGRITE